MNNADDDWLNVSDWVCVRLCPGVCLRGSIANLCMLLAQPLSESIAGVFLYAHKIDQFSVIAIIYHSQQISVRCLRTPIDIKCHYVYYTMFVCVCVCIIFKTDKYCVTCTKLIIYKSTQTSTPHSAYKCLTITGHILIEFVHTYMRICSVDAIECVYALHIIHNRF